MRQFKLVLTEKEARLLTAIVATGVSTAIASGALEEPGEANGPELQEKMSKSCTKLVIAIGAMDESTHTTLRNKLWNMTAELKKEVAK